MIAQLKQLVLFASLLVSFRAGAVDAFEIQVYDGRINEIGQFSLETHLNNVIKGSPAATEPGEVSDNHLTHLTFEFARGMTPYWELGAYLQSAWLPNGRLEFGGAKLRTKFVLPKETAGAFHLGANFEVAYIPLKFEPTLWSGEIRPVFGYAAGRWLFLTNPIIGVPLSGPDRELTFEPAFKIESEVAPHFGLGLEYFWGSGAIANLVPMSRAEQYLFVVYDLLDGPVELNLGLGRGLNSDSAQTVAKVIFGFDF